MSSVRLPSCVGIVPAIPGLMPPNGLERLSEVTRLLVMVIFDQVFIFWVVPVPHVRRG